MLMQTETEQTAWLVLRNLPDTNFSNAIGSDFIELAQVTVV